MQTRKQVFICNMAIIALCIVSIVAYFIMPFWRVSVKYTLTAEALEEILPDSSENASEETNDILSNVNFAELVEEGVTLSLAIELQTVDVLGAMGAQADALVKTILQNNVNSIVTQLDPVINQMVKKVVKTVVKTTFVEELKTQIKNNLTEGATDEQVQQELEAIGLTEEEIDKKAEQLVDAVYAENATVDTVVDETIDIVKDSLESMKESGKEEYADIELSPETEAELRDQLSEQLASFAKEDGTLDPEGFTADFLLGMLKENTDTAPEETARVSLAKPLSAQSGSQSSEQTQDQTQEQRDAKEELKQLLTDKLMGLLGDATPIIATVLNVICYVILFTFFTWAYLIIKILAKLKKANNAIKLKLPIWLGSLPYVILCLIPTIALKTLTGKVIPDLGPLVISFSSCSIVSFIIGLVLAVFSIAYYGRLRKHLKKLAKLQEVNAAFEPSAPTLETTPDEGILPPLDADEEDE